MKVKYFKATKQTHRFRENQKVWVRYEHANHTDIFYKFRGNGRWVCGVCDRWAVFIGDIKEIDVEDSFADKIHGDHKKERHAEYKHQ